MRARSSQSPTDALLQGKFNVDVLLSVTNTNEGPLFVNQTAEYDVAEYVRNLFPLFGTEESNAAAAIYASLGSPLDQVNAIMGEAILKCPTYSFLDAFSGESYKAGYAISPALHAQDITNYFPSRLERDAHLQQHRLRHSLLPDLRLVRSEFDPNSKLRPSITPVWPKWSQGAETEMVFNETESGAPSIARVNTSSALLQRCEFCKSVRNPTVH